MTKKKNKGNVTDDPPTGTVMINGREHSECCKYPTYIMHNRTGRRIKICENCLREITDTNNTLGK